MLFISTHKIKGRYWKYGSEILRQKTEKMQLFITHFVSSEELISTDQSVQMYFTVFGFCQTLILMQIFKENISGKNNLFYRAKICLLLKTFFLNSATSGVISGIKCYQFNEFDPLLITLNEFDALLITLKYYTLRFF